MVFAPLSKYIPDLTISRITILCDKPLFSQLVCYRRFHAGFIDPILTCYSLFSTELPEGSF